MIKKIKFDTTTAFPDRNLAEQAREKLRPLAVGDRITAMGISIKIKELMSSSLDIEFDNSINAYVLYFMCEFINTKGHYGYYKSFFDKGSVELIGLESEDK